MEKTWDDFLKSGKVTDYLRYRNEVDSEKDKKERIYNGTDSYIDRDGADSHADRRL